MKSRSKYRVGGGGLAMNVSPVKMNNSAPQIRQPRCIHSNRLKLALSPQGCSQHLQPLSNCYQVERLPGSCQIWTDLHPTQALFSKCFRQGGKASNIIQVFCTRQEKLWPDPINQESMGTELHKSQMRKS